MTPVPLPDAAATDRLTDMLRRAGALVEAGVSGYDRCSLDGDYRWSVLLGMLRPIWQATGGLPARVWWPNLERNALAFDDLGCADLLA